MSPPRSILLIFCLTTLVVGAHESPEHSIKHLTEHIQIERSAGNLYQRAIAYRATGQMEKAATDLREAINLDPENLDYHLELCRVLLAQQKLSRALNYANRALKIAHTPPQRAVCHIMRAEAYHRSGRAKPALQSCQLAFKEVPKGEIEWFILRSETQLTLGHLEQRITDLKIGHLLHHSAVLKSHWIDALIDAGEFQTALPLVESELSERRLKSSWLIKRARILQGLERPDEAASDLAQAQSEIKARLNPARPDIFLLADQTRIHILKGNRNEAKKSLALLKKHRAPFWITSRLEALIK